MLYATVRQRKIHVKNPTTVIRNGINVDWLTLDMDEEWKEMTSISCVFTLHYSVQEEQPVEKEEDATPEEQTETGETEDDTNKEETKLVTVEKEESRTVVHTFGKPVLVPWECLTETGNLSVSCTGYVDNEKVMTTMLPDSFWTVVQNGPVSDKTPMEPTLTLYEQVVAAAGAAQTAAQAANAVAVELRTAKENGDFDGVSPTVEVGTVSAGSEAQVTNSGTSQKAVLNFILPRGPVGPRGERGTIGPRGERGEKGEKPVAGVDYWTPEEKSAMILDVLKALPTYNGEVE